MAVMLTRGNVIDGAVRGVLAAHLVDYRKGAIEWEDLVEMAQRRAASIRDEFRATIHRLRVDAKGARCSGQVLGEGAALTRCRQPGNTVIGGRSYCAGCAAAVRLPDPRGTEARA